MDGTRIVTKEYKGHTITYEESFYMDFVVDENTGKRDIHNQACFYTKTQMDQNLKNLREAYQKLLNENKEE